MILAKDAGAVNTPTTVIIMAADTSRLMCLLIDWVNIVMGPFCRCLLVLLCGFGFACEKASSETNCVFRVLFGVFYYGLPFYIPPHFPCPEEFPPQTGKYETDKGGKFLRRRRGLQRRRKSIRAALDPQHCSTGRRRGHSRKVEPADD